MMQNNSSHISTAHFAPSTAKIMWYVVLALLPGIAVRVFWDGSRYLGIMIIAIFTALTAEAFILLMRGRYQRIFSTWCDGSTVLSACLLALSLPATLPPWLIIIGTLFAIIFAKQLYGGLGMNIFNPAMVGFCFLLISFPSYMGQQSITTLPLSSFWHPVDITTGATTLDAARQLRIIGNSLANLTVLSLPLITLNIAWLIGGLWLAYRRYLDWKISLATVIGIFITASIFYGVNSNYYLNPIAQLLTGAGIFGVFFIATDPVTAATTPIGRWLFGGIIGILTVCIRNLGNFPDGFAFAVLIANAVAPLIDSYTQPRYR